MSQNTQSKISNEFMSLLIRINFNINVVLYQSKDSRTHCNHCSGIITQSQSLTQKDISYFKKYKVTITISSDHIIVSCLKFRYMLITFPFYLSIFDNKSHSNNLTTKNKKDKHKLKEDITIQPSQSIFISISLVENNIIDHPQYQYQHNTIYDINKLYQQSKEKEPIPLVKPAIPFMTPKNSQLIHQNQSIKDKSFDEIYNTLIKMKKERDETNNQLNKTVFAIKNPQIMNMLSIGVNIAN